MSSAVAKLSKPVMRGMHVNEIKRNIAGAAMVGFLFLPWGVMNLSLRMVTMIIVYALYEIENSNIEMRRGMLFSHYSDVAW